MELWLLCQSQHLLSLSFGDAYMLEFVLVCSLHERVYGHAPVHVI